MRPGRPRSVLRLKWPSFLGETRAVAFSCVAVLGLWPGDATGVLYLSCLHVPRPCPAYSVCRSLVCLGVNLALSLKSNQSYPYERHCLCVAVGQHKS